MRRDAFDNFWQGKKKQRAGELPERKALDGAELVLGGP
jgi:UPF0716 family protein affecting phage T7 exclusion